MLKISHGAAAYEEKWGEGVVITHIFGADGSEISIGEPLTLPLTLKYGDKLKIETYIKINVELEAIQE